MERKTPQMSALSSVTGCGFEKSLYLPNPVKAERKECVGELSDSSTDCLSQLSKDLRGKFHRGRGATHANPNPPYLVTVNSQAQKRLIVRKENV